MKKNWTFFTNYSHVLFYIFYHPEMPMKEIAIHVGITERAVHRIIKELEEGGALEIEKIGRQNKYHVNQDIPLRHSIEAHKTIAGLLAFIQGEMEST